jgi:hypothetical protein
MQPMQRDLELGFCPLFFLFVTIIRKLEGSHEELTPEQCCGSGSGIRCLFDPWSGIRDRFFLDPELGDNNFVKFVATENGMTTNFFSTPLFFAVFGSGIRDG